LLFIKHISDDEIKENEVSEACDKYGEEKWTHIFGRGI